MNGNTHNPLRLLTRLLSVIAFMVIMTTAGAQNRVTLETAAGTTKPNEWLAKFLDRNSQTLLVQHFLAHPDNEDLYRAIKNATILNEEYLIRNYSISEVEAMQQFVDLMNKRMLKLEPHFNQGLSYPDAMSKLMTSPTD